MTSIFTADASTQGTGGFTNTKTYNTKDNPNMRLFSKSRTVSCDEFKKRIKDGYIDNVSLIIFNQNLSKAILDTAKRYDELAKKKSKEADTVEANKLLNNVFEKYASIENLSILDLTRYARFIKSLF